MLNITAVILLLAAPMPFWRERGPRELRPSDLVGIWDVKWGAIPCTMVFEGDGYYRCWWCGNTVYTGSWKLWQGKRLWIVESNRPDIPGSWHSYAIHLRREADGRFAGPVMEGARGVEFRMLKRLPRRPDAR